MATQTITPVELREALTQQAATLLDVRTPAEFREVRLRGTTNVPLDRLDADKVPRPSPGQPLYVICQRGGRGAQACERLSQAGLTNVLNVEGGTEACIAEGLPVDRGQKTISLERQVRVAAGSLVLLGVALSYLHPAFLALSAFVGAGLVFAGLTDTCGMAMVLARMPWNQVKDPSGWRTSPNEPAV